MARARRITRWLALLTTLALLFAIAIPLQGASAQPLAQATPVAGATQGSLADMLGHLGDLPFGHNSAMVTYADVAGQVAALQVAAPRDGAQQGAQEWISAILPLALPQSTAQHWSSPEWREAFGFDLYQVEQAVEYADPPFSLTVLRGSFEPDELRAAWGNAGYQPVDLGAGEAYAVRSDSEIDFSTAAGRMALGHHNVIAIADDGSLILSSTQDGVRQALAASAGLGPSFAARAEIAPLLSAVPPDLVSAVILPGEALRASPDLVGIITGEASPETIATRVAAELDEAARLPQVVAALFGQTAGLVPDSQRPAVPATPGTVPIGQAARLVAMLRFLSPDQATEAARVIEERLATGHMPTDLSAAPADRPWRDIFPQRAVHPVPGEPVALIELTPAAGVPPFILLDLVYRRTPGFLGWG